MQSIDSYCQQLHQASSLAAIVFIALQLGLLFAHLTLEKELNTKANDSVMTEIHSWCINVPVSRYPFKFG